VSLIPRVLVIGGGVAGITAALDGAGAGARVTLVEVRRRLGGAAYSFERDGLHIDNGQHVFLRCCESYRELLGRLGSGGRVFVQPRLEIPVLKPGSPAALLRRDSLPAPAHLARALARYPHLTVSERLRTVPAALGLMRLSHDAGAGSQALDQQNLGEWLGRHGQGAAAVEALWDLVALPTLNVRADQASLALGAFVFAKGLFSSAEAGDIGFHRSTLGQTIGEPAAEALGEAGVDVRLGWRAEGLQRAGSGFVVNGRSGREAAGGEELVADAVIVAVPHARAAALIEPLLGELASVLRRLESSPIVNLHVVYDRKVSEHEFAAGVGTPVQYLFDRTEAAGAPAGSQYLAVSLSGAEREMGMSVDALREQYLAALEELLPHTRRAKVERFLVTREHAATFRAAPGVARLRPPARTSLPGLLLAGAWTDTGWPATLEGATLSGHAAAEAALQVLELASPRELAGEDPAELVSRMDSPPVAPWAG
jgi:hydroxysqualene dehydroxylase